MFAGFADHLAVINPDCSTLGAVLPLDYLSNTCSPSKLLPTRYCTHFVHCAILHDTIFIVDFRVLKDLLLCLDDSGAIHVICTDIFVTMDVWSKVSNEHILQ